MDNETSFCLDTTPIKIYHSCILIFIEDVIIHIYFCLYERFTHK